MSQRHEPLRPMCDLERGLRPPQELEAVGGVARAAQLGRVRLELVEAGEQLVVGVDALVALSADRLERRDPLLDLELGDRGRRRDLVEEVPVGGERLGDRAQLLELHAGGEAEHDDRLVRGLVDQLVHEPFPARRRTRHPTRSRRGPRRAAAGRPRSGIR